MVHIPDWHMVKRGRGERERETMHVGVGVRFTKAEMV